MRVRRIEIHNYKKLIGPVVVDGLGDGLTVIAGDNEEGKSTVLSALRSVLFERHNLTGEAAERMQPFGSNVRPEIRLDFELGGRLYRLTKAFCQRPNAELLTPQGTFAGSAAEDRLRELLSFHSPQRGPARPEEHYGIFGLFWVEQGRTFEAIRLSEDNQATLVSALESEVGQVLGGKRGQALKQAIARAYGAYFTETGRPKAAFLAGDAGVSRLEAEIAALRTRLVEYEGKVDQLARVREQRSLYEREARLARAEARLKEAEAAVATLDSLRRQGQAAKSEWELAEASVDAPTAAWRRREESIARSEKAAAAAEAARDELATAQATLAPASDAARLADEYVAAAERMTAATDAKLQIAERRAERATRVAELAELTERHGKAVAIAEAARAAAAAAAAIKVNEAALRRLQALERERVEAAAALAASATMMSFRLDADGQVLVAGRPAPASGEMLVSTPTEIALRGVGSILITPGGIDLEQRRRAAERAELRLREALEKVGARSLAEAEALAGERQQQEVGAASDNRALAALAPEGLEVLAHTLEAARVALARLPVAEDGSETLDLEQARTDRREAEHALADARLRRDAAQAELSTARERVARADAIASAAHAAAIDAARQLENERQRFGDQALREGIATAAARAATAKARHEAAEIALEAADPEATELRFAEAREGLAAVRRELDNLARREETLAAELRALGQQGLGEEVQELEGQLLTAKAQRDRVNREARSLKLLWETLVKAETAARETFLAPVKSCLQPYLRLLLPETELVLSDVDLRITHLRRGNHEEPFEALSIGTREQIAVLTRLAFADLLRERGVAAPVVLDDALVYCDDGRFERMRLALRRASQQTQIIVLTCHERDWVEAGAPIRRLTECTPTATPRFEPG